MTSRSLLGIALVASLALIGPAMAQVDQNDPLIIKGETLFNRCRACHAFKPDTRSLSRGPNLWGVVGRKSGTAPGYTDYSQAMLKANVVWTPENIDKYLTDPRKFIPNNLMNFIGVPKPDERQALVAFLVKVSKQAPPTAQTTGLKLYRVDDED